MFMGTSLLLRAVQQIQNLVGAPTFSRALNAATADTAEGPDEAEVECVMRGLLGCYPETTATSALALVEQRVADNWAWTTVLKALLIYHRLVVSDTTTTKWLAEFQEEFTVSGKAVHFREGDGVDLQAESHSRIIRVYASYLNELAAVFIHSSQSRDAGAFTKIEMSRFARLAKIVRDSSQHRKSLYLLPEVMAFTGDRDDEDLCRLGQTLLSLCRCASRCFVKWETSIEPPCPTGDNRRENRESSAGSGLKGVHGASGVSSRKPAGGHRKVVTLSAPTGFKGPGHACLRYLYADVAVMFPIAASIVSTLLNRATKYASPNLVGDVLTLHDSFYICGGQIEVLSQFVKSLSELDIPTFAVDELCLMSHREEREFIRAARDALEDSSLQLSTLEEYLSAAANGAGNSPQPRSRYAEEDRSSNYENKHRASSKSSRQKSRRKKCPGRRGRTTVVIREESSSSPSDSSRQSDSVSEDDQSATESVSRDGHKKDHRAHSGRGDNHASREAGGHSLQHLKSKSSGRPVRVLSPFQKPAVESILSFDGEDELNQKTTNTTFVSSLDLVTSPGIGLDGEAYEGATSPVATIDGLISMGRGEQSPQRSQRRSPSVGQGVGNDAKVLRNQGSKSTKVKASEIMRTKAKSEKHCNRHSRGHHHHRRKLETSDSDSEDSRLSIDSSEDNESHDKRKESGSLSQDGSSNDSDTGGRQIIIIRSKKKSARSGKKKL